MKSKMLTQAFIISESFFFLTLIIAYVSYGNIMSSGPASVHSLEPKKTGFFTLFLIASSLTMWMGQRGFRKERFGAFKAWLGGTIVLGSVFMYGQMKEYLKLYSEHVTIHRNIFASGFYTLTGFHSLHVVIGLIILLIVFGLMLFGDAKKMGPSAVEGAALYWHFVDVVWIFVFTVVYLIPLFV